MTSTLATTCTGKGSGVRQRVAGFCWSARKNRVEGCVLDTGHGAHVVVHLVQHIGLYRRR